MDDRGPIRNRIEDASKGHGPALKENISGEPSGRDRLTQDVKTWVMKPVIGFQMAGFAALVWLSLEFFYSGREMPAYVWTALIVAFAGIPFGFATNVKKMMNAITVDSN